MTQKELLYVEDAIGHEKSIIEICKNSITKCDDTEFKNFFEQEISKHQNIENNLMTLLKEKANG